MRLELSARNLNVRSCFQVLLSNSTCATASGGSITLDGVDINRLRITELRASIGVVSQEPLLFEATLRMNIAVGRAGAAADAVSLGDVQAGDPLRTTTRPTWCSDEASPVRASI